MIVFRQKDIKYSPSMATVQCEKCGRRYLVGPATSVSDVKKKARGDGWRRRWFIFGKLICPLCAAGL